MTPTGTMAGMWWSCEQALTVSLLADRQFVLCARDYLELDEGEMSCISMNGVGYKRHNFVTGQCARCGAVQGPKMRRSGFVQVSVEQKQAWLANATAVPRRKRAAQ